MALRYGGVGVGLPINQLGCASFNLQNMQAILVPPGTWDIYTDGIAGVQNYDPIMNIWVPIGGDPASSGGGTALSQLDSDGTNFRIVNSTSCPIGALLTNGGSGYTSAPTVTPSEGNSTWRAIVGGLVNTSVTLSSGGKNYTYPPTLLVSPPPAGGIPAVMRITTISGGVVQGITVVAQGAGYTTAPSITFLNDPRDTTGSGAVAVAALTGSGVVSGVLCTDYGSTAVTSGTVPTLAFAGGGGTSAAATALMDWVVTSYAVTAGGGGYAGTAALLEVFGTGVPTSAAAAYTNPFTQSLLLRARPGLYEAAISANAITATGQQALQYARVGGITSHVNYAVVAAAGGAAPSTVATLTLAVGGVASFVYMQTAQA